MNTGFFVAPVAGGVPGSNHRGKERRPASPDGGPKGIPRAVALVAHAQCDRPWLASGGIHQGPLLFPRPAFPPPCSPPQVVHYLLSKGALPDCPRDDGATPLHIAAQRGHCEVKSVRGASDPQGDIFSEHSSCPPPSPGY